VAADDGKSISARVTVSAPGHTDASATSASTTVGTLVCTASTCTGLFRFYNTDTMAHFYTVDVAERDHVRATWPQFSYEGVVGRVVPGIVAKDANQTPVYRFYNVNTMTHFYTADAAERDRVIATWPNVFTFEGPKYVAYTKQVPGTTPLYRFYNMNTMSHFYTADAAERDRVIATWPNIFSYEGIAYYIFPA
jgi:hypothetical protein